MPTVTVQQALELAMQHHSAGRLAEAGAIYRQILAQEPNNAGALHLLGVVAGQTGRNDMAVDLIRKAIALKPAAPAFHSSLGEVYRRAGRWPEAVAAFRAVLQLTPDQADAYNNLGVTLRSQGCRVEAIAAYRRALELKPDSVEIHYNLGNALKEQGQLDEAITAYRHALRLKPDFVEARYNLGNALVDQNRLDEAIAEYRHALQFQPDSAEAHSNLGNALREQGRLDEAIAACRRALEIKPGLVEAHNNLGTAVYETGCFDEAMAVYRRALEYKPDNPTAKFNHSLLLLLRGELQRAWPLYEAARWDADRFPSPKRNFPQPMWDGRLLEGQRVLIHAEQGFGDSIQFVRYAPLVARRGGTVVVECQQSLADLFRSMRDVNDVVAAGGPLPSFDLHVPMLSLPFVFKTTLEMIPLEIPYLVADPARCETWRGRITGDRPRLKVGLAWAGNTQHRMDRTRSLHLRQLLPLLDVDGVDFFSLQKGEGAEQLQELSGAARIIDHTNNLEDFADTAALLMQLDLVISVDTAVAHLTAALGGPVWTLLAFAPDWRWMLNRTDSPWYPTMRLFRQPRVKDWDSVIREVRKQLELLATSRR